MSNIQCHILNVVILYTLYPVSGFEVWFLNLKAYNVPYLQHIHVVYCGMLLKIFLKYQRFHFFSSSSSNTYTLYNWISQPDDQKTRQHRIPPPNHRGWSSSPPPPRRGRRRPCLNLWLNGC